MIRGAALFVLALLSGCAPMRDRVVLLPGADGRTGALVVKAGGNETVLDSAYASVDVAVGRGAGVSGGGPAAAPAALTTPAKLSGTEVNSRYAALLQAQPWTPRAYTMYFVSGASELTPHSRLMLEMIKVAMSTTPAADVVVVGHADRVGRERANDRLSLRRARAARDALVNMGIPAEAIEVAARGEHDLAVPTKDQVPELRNRRVEIRVR